MSKKIIQTFTSHNVIDVTLEHNGSHGVDANSECFVKLAIENLSNTNMEVNGHDCEKFEIHLKGESERETFLSALKMVVKELEENPTV